MNISDQFTLRFACKERMERIEYKIFPAADSYVTRFATLIYILRSAIYVKRTLHNDLYTFYHPFKLRAKL